MTTSVNKEEMLKDLAKIYKEQGKISRAIYEQNGGRFGFSTFQKKFGSWNNAVKLIGGDEYERNISKEAIVGDMERVHNELGKLSKSDYKKFGKYSVNTVKRQVSSDGSWNGALIQAGLNINMVMNIPDEELLSELTKLYNEYGEVSSRLIKEQGAYSIEVYVRRFGLNNALELAGVPVNNQYGFSKSAEITIRLFEEILSEKAEREKQFDWLINPRTGRKMFIDAYFSKSGICLEYNGEQHYKEDAFGADNLEAIQFRDNTKYSLIEENGLKLVIVKYDEPLDKDHMIKKLCV